jgi:hypothetical protein
MEGLVAGRIVHGVLVSGAIRPVIVVDVVNPDDERPTIHGTMFTLGRADGHDSHSIYFQGRYSEGEQGVWVPHSWHWPTQTEPVPASDPEPASRPVPLAGDRVMVGDREGVITEVKGDTASQITLFDNNEVVTDVTYTYVDVDKAKADELYQQSKKN